jgi:hypothetical protein
VWDAIYRAEHWPEWWKGVQRVETLKPPGPDGLGGLTRYVWKSALPYELVIDTTTTRLDYPRAMDGMSTGELEGDGHWRLSSDGGVTTVRYEWNVATTKPWMNLLAPLLRPAFAWNHDVVMRQGGEGLRRLLETPVVRIPGFDPLRLAYLETAIWRAYYDRRWLTVLRLTVQLVHDQFGLSWPRAIQAAYYTTRASIAWAPAQHDLDAVGQWLLRFYQLARTHGRSVRLDPKRVADLELRYWIVHRDLSGRPLSEKTPLEDSLAELHSAIFGLPLDACSLSGVARARAADTVDEITSHRSPDVPLDWARVERHLRDAYTSLAAQLAR